VVGASVNVMMSPVVVAAWQPEIDAMTRMVPNVVRVILFVCIDLLLPCRGINARSVPLFALHAAITIYRLALIKRYPQSEGHEKREPRSSGDFLILHLCNTERLYQHMRIGCTACNRLLAGEFVHHDLGMREHRTIDLEEIEASRLERVVEWLSVVPGGL